jgi:hypothetical protein
MQYALVNFTTQTTEFFRTFSEASAACTAYHVKPNHRVYIVDLEENAIEKL